MSTKQNTWDIADTQIHEEEQMREQDGERSGHRCSPQGRKGFSGWGSRGVLLIPWVITVGSVLCMKKETKRHRSDQRFSGLRGKFYKKEDTQDRRVSFHREGSGLHL